MKKTIVLLLTMVFAVAAQAADTKACLVGKTCPMAKSAAANKNCPKDKASCAACKNSDQAKAGCCKATVAKKILSSPKASG